jgi:hypothetical protein
MQGLNREATRQLKKRHEGSEAYIAWSLIEQAMRNCNSSQELCDIIKHWISYKKQVYIHPTRLQQWKYALSILEDSKEVK